MAIFFVSDFVGGNVVFASVPKVVDCKFNNESQSITFNPNNSTTTISVISDQPTHFNTIAICNDSDTWTCHRWGN